MDYIQKKTADRAVEHFLLKAADQEVSLAWDRYEGQLPECGFCESGLSCRDCLQGPCISHPFRDTNKVGVCGKDKDTLAAQTLLRLVLKGSMAFLDQASELVREVTTGAVEPKEKDRADRIVKDIQELISRGGGGAGSLNELPEGLVDRWSNVGVFPEGLARDLLKASQKLEGGICSVEQTLLWAFKSAVFGYLVQWLKFRLEQAVFGQNTPTYVDVNLGVLQTDTPNILLCGTISASLKKQILEKAKANNINVMGVCTNPLLTPFAISPVSNYGSQEIPLMTGAVDLVVAAEHYVNPSLKEVAKDWIVKVMNVNGLKAMTDLNGFAEEVVKKAQEAFDLRKDIPRDIPGVKETAVFGFTSGNLDVKKIAAALSNGSLKGIALFAGSNNVKFTQDRELTTIAEIFLQKDILCISSGEASIGLAKYGFLNPGREKACGAGIKDL
ncbi:MAG: hypothetical protein JRI77_13330, partial [Deltaproteobacteria bacterium]|nr:hypothetical protein [Deltaproteobacteria bacterium]